MLQGGEGGCSAAAPEGRPVYLLSNNPRKAEALGVPPHRRLPCLVPPVSAAAALYLKAKAQRMGHDIPAGLWALAAAGGAGSAGSS